MYVRHVHLRVTQAVANRLAGQPKRTCHCTHHRAGACIHTDFVILAVVIACMHRPNKLLPTLADADRLAQKKLPLHTHLGRGLRPHQALYVFNFKTRSHSPCTRTSVSTCVCMCMCIQRVDTYGQYCHLLSIFFVVGLPLLSQCA